MSIHERAPESPTLEFLLEALGSAVVALQAVPAGTQVPIRSVALLAADDLAVAEPGVAVADLCVLAGVSARSATAWVDRLALDLPAVRPAMLVIKDATPQLCRAAESAGIAVGALHAQARADMVLSTVRSLIEGAAGRASSDDSSGDPFVDELDLYGLAQRVAALSGGLVSIEDDQSRLLAYSATDGAADELRMLSILGREGPVEHLRRLRALGVYDQLQTGGGVVEVPAEESLGWRRRLVVSIRPLGRASARLGDSGSSLGTIWIQEGHRPLEPDTASVLEGAAAIAARLIYRARSAPTQEARQIQRLLGLRGGGVDVPTLASALALTTSGPAAVVGISLVDGGELSLTPELPAALRLLAAAYARDSLVATGAERLYILLPRSTSTGLAGWVTGVLDRLASRFGRELRAAIAAPVPSLEDARGARGEVDRVLDRPVGVSRVASLTQSRTPVLLGEICDLVRSRPELRDPRLQLLTDYDRDRDASLVETLQRYLSRFGDVRSAAADLHVHPNTLRYRLRRAEQVLGISLDDPDARLLLQIQLLLDPNA